jgi:hypothetical protein
MSEAFAAPSSLPATLRGWVARIWGDPDSRSVTIGIAGMILIHLLLWLVGPHLLRMEHVPVAPRPHATGKDFNIELDPEMFLKPAEKQPEPFKFVETNPEAPENTPDKTVNFAAQNQQVAQEKPTPDGTNDTPALEGQTERQTNQIVNGQLTKPIEHLEAIPPAPETPPQEQSVAAQQRAEQNPLSGFEKKEGESQDTFGTNLAKSTENTRPIPERIEGAKVPLIQDAVAMQPAIDRNRPRPRPQIVQTIKARPAVLTENKFGTKNIGPTAVDARWSNYGSYLQRMIDTVQIQWERILVEWNALPASGSTVTVKFIMDDEGRIAQIVNVDTTANETSSRACVSAITDRAPYGAWTDDMKAVLGTKQEMTFTFYYQ